MYSDNIERWEVMNAVCDGARAVKKLGLALLPFKIDCDDNRNRYKDYLNRAVFYPVTKDTLQNHVGLAFSEDPDFDPDGMDFLKDNADGAGTSIYCVRECGKRIVK